jgi:hypothetical protein
MGRRTWKRRRGGHWASASTILYVIDNTVYDIHAVSLLFSSFTLCKMRPHYVFHLFDSQHIIRKNAVRLMLSYRAANVRDREKWVAILDEGFVFTLPITPYR